MTFGSTEQRCSLHTTSLLPLKWFFAHAIAGHDLAFLVDQLTLRICAEILWITCQGPLCMTSSVNMFPPLRDRSPLFRVLFLNGEIE